jgi:uncharacterized protein involved in exopolysaccharide biosynthesis
MNNRTVGVPLPPEAGSEEEEFDFQRLKELVGFLLRAPRRRPRLTAALFVLVMGFGLTVAAYWPRTYGADARILAQHNLVLPALDNPNRSVPREADTPTKNAADTIMKRDNIVALVKELDLVDRWEATRQPILRIKDKVSRAISGPRADEDRLLDLIGLLEKRLVVGTDESSINITIEWPDRDMAYEIVSLVLKNFLEARYDSNVNVITEAIRILEERAKPQSEEVDKALDELSKAEAQRRTKISAIKAPTSVRTSHVVRTVAPSASSGSKAAPAPDDDLPLVTQLEEVRHRIREVEDEQHHHLAEAQNQLVDARTTLGPLHPTVLALNEKIATLSDPPAELAPLKARERELVAKLAKASAPPPASSASANAGKAHPASPAAAGTTVTTVAIAAAENEVNPDGLSSGVRDTLADLMRDDPETALARSKLQAATTKYSELLSRIEAAKIELDVTRASFKYQYTVVRPPELARRPLKPNVTLLMAVSVLLALFVSILVPGALDLARGRFVEPWQVERALGLPLLGELNPPS